MGRVREESIANSAVMSAKTDRAFFLYIYLKFQNEERCHDGVGERDRNRDQESVGSIPAAPSLLFASECDMLHGIFPSVRIGTRKRT